MISPVAFTVFGKDIYWYGIIMASAMLLGIFLASRLLKRKGEDPDLIYDLAILVIPLAIVGARTYYVLFQLDYYAMYPFWEVFAVWHGGLAIYGGVIGGLIGLVIFSRWKKISFFKLADVVAPALILGQAIGRWGNFFNQEAYGEAVNNIALQFFPVSVFIEATGRYHYATFFYESMWNLLVFAVLMLYSYDVIWKKKERVNGDVFVLYLVLYGFGRFFIEGLRTDSLMLGSLRVSQVLSGVMVICGVLYFIFQKKILARFKKAEPAAEGIEEPAVEETAEPAIEAAEESMTEVQEECAVIEEEQDAPAEEVIPEAGETVEVPEEPDEEQAQEAVAEDEQKE